MDKPTTEDRQRAKEIIVKELHESTQLEVGDKYRIHQTTIFQIKEGYSTASGKAVIKILEANNDKP